ERLAVEDGHAGDGDREAVRVERNGRSGEGRVAGRGGDPAPVRIAAVDRGLDQAAADHLTSDSPRLRVVGGAADLAREQRRGARARGGLRAGERARARLDRADEGLEGWGPCLEGRRAASTGGEQEHRVVRARVAVDGELVPGALDDWSQDRPQLRGLDGGIGE